ncbi:MAG TPA: 23S rRNA (adenine(2503)-C(2))-methyltransferase RlmN [Geminicoccaceae bacterium]|jgi:23S rRNA (adenine2503-C2)-methyltransferase|nr:23S rRNA (adenine(2503)-C(2))-methyltransferase RlmN [Geminicoccaceae bacterium]
MALAALEPVDARAPAARPSLIGRSRAELADVVRALGEPERTASMRTRQLWHWLYRQGATDPAAMTTLPKGLRERLTERYRNDRPRVVEAQVSADGTRKWLLRLADGREVETVYIPEPDRGALCISTQVGCSLTCSFCHTGTMPLVRNLRAEEIVAQVLIARDALGEWPTPTGPRRLSHIVVMGMGEPLLNYEETSRALSIAMDADGLAFARRRITLSTSGVVPKIEICGRELGVALAVSLHAVRDELRDQLVPLNRKWNIAALLDACQAYAAHTDRAITFEYVMLDAINDSDADARELVRLIRGIPAKINLIPFNPWPGAPYRCSLPERIAAFAAIVSRAGYPAPVRTPRGRDILAACGQLKTASERRRRDRIAA